MRDRDTSPQDDVRLGYIQSYIHMRTYIYISPSSLSVTCNAGVSVTIALGYKVIVIAARYPLLPFPYYAFFPSSHVIATKLQ